MLVALGCGAAGRAEVAIVDCTLIDGTGRPPVTGAVVLIRNGTIAAVGTEATVGNTTRDRKISLHGAWLLPGFINAHVHSLYNDASYRTWLSAGVTTVRDLGYSDTPGYLGRRDALNRNPSCARAISATPMITHTGGYGTVYVNGPEQARQTVGRYVRQGADLVKIAIEDDLQGQKWLLLSASEIQAAVEQSHALKRRVSAHISHVRNLRFAIDAGVDDLAHMVVEPLSRADAATIARKGIAWVPTLELWKGVSEKHALDWDKIAIRNTGTFFRAGGMVALGTDFNGYTIPFDTGFPITEARLLLQAGLSPMDVIVAGTRNAAVVCGRASDLGTIEIGKVADFLAVARNPLQDISALQEPVQVFKSGRPVLPQGPR